MQYGNKHKVTTYKDNDGNEVRRVDNETYRDGLVVKNEVIYEVRQRVKDAKAELSEYLAWRKEYGDNRISFDVDYPKDYDGSFYYIIKTYKSPS